MLGNLKMRKTRGIKSVKSHKFRATSDINPNLKSVYHVLYLPCRFKKIIK